MSYADTQPFISDDSSPRGNVSGTVNMAAYAKWLDEHGYDLNLSVGGGW